MPDNCKGPWGSNLRVKSTKALQSNQRKQIQPLVNLCFSSSNSPRAWKHPVLKLETNLILYPGSELPNHEDEKNALIVKTDK